MKLKFIINSLLLVTPIGLSAVEAAKSESPNILFILSDDQGWSQLSKSMSPDISGSSSGYLSTPNIDRLGDAGLRFINGYSPAPICTPTRRSILCGVSTARGGTEFKSSYVPAEHMTIPKALKQANPQYICAHFGKWGGPTMISSPEECNYDFSNGITGNPEGGMPVSLGVKGGHNDGPPHFIDNKDPKRTGSVTDAAIEIMRRSVKEKRPFYVQVSYYAVHLSVVCKEETLAKYLQKGEPDRSYTPAWAAMMDEMDQGVGRLLEMVEKLNISDNTYIFFMSDNGGTESIPGKNVERRSPNYPLSGAKSTLLEGGIRVPFIVKGPGISPGSYSHVPVVGYDLLPTFFDLAGGKFPLPGDIDGGSIMPLFSNPVNGVVKRPLDELIFHHPGALSSAIRQGPYKLFVTWNQEGEIESRALYNLEADVVENTKSNLATTKTSKTNEMEKILLNYLKLVDAKNPTTIREYFSGNQKVARLPNGSDD